ncbi:MAG: YigZ family protein [Clostridia bacterium]|nr:YigZ family protein [Clostridia bacterium]
MAQDTGYRTVKAPSSLELVIQKSRFIGQCFPIASEEEALELLTSLRKKYWDATHNCYAYSVGEKGEIARFSDDGEPGGTAGMPMMDALRGAGVTNVLCVVTRYFGGILLGTGGLVRAYSRSCSEAIRAAGVVRMALCDSIEYSVPYPQWAMFQAEARKQGASLMPEYGEVVRCVTVIEAEKTKAFTDAVFDQSAGSLTGTVRGHEYRPLDEHEE